jgi:ribokinase
MIAVVGSVNRDVVVAADVLPGPGETVLGTGHVEMPGGKGANQAVAAARLGARVSFVGRVGDDHAGRALIEAFAADGVDTAHLSVAGSAPTGLAVITVDAAGENAIVISPGANRLVGVSDVADAGSLLRAATVTLLQLEVPVPTVTDAAGASGGTVILNAAPARELPDELLSAVDVMVVNTLELETLTGSADPASATDLGVPVTVVTLGADGAAVVTAAGVTISPSPQVDVVDTTGAGDAFCGALAAGLDAGLSIGDSVSRAVVAGALATTAVGARSAMPTAEELDAALGAQSSQGGDN